MYLILKNGQRVEFDGGCAILDREDIDNIDPTELIEHLKWVMDEIKIVYKYCCDKMILWNEYAGNISFEQLQDKFAESVRMDSQKESIKLLTKRRRLDFSKIRDDLKLALIDRDGLICSEPGCKEYKDITIDHIIPVSKGGTDDLENLRFLCRSHNTQKSDRNGKSTT